MGLSVFLTLLPIMAIVYLMVRKQLAADLSGIVGWVLTVIITLLFFNTSLGISLTSSLAGIISSFPVSLMVLTSILQITFMQTTGALQRIVVFIKTLAPTDKAVQIMLLNVGAGTLLVSIGATPVSILPPIMIALGYSTFVAVALPAIGFDALCTFALLGAPLVVFADLTGTPLVESAQVFAKFLPVISTLIGFGMLWIVGRTRLMIKGFIPCVLAGVTNGGVAIAMSHIPILQSGIVLTGVVAGLCTILVMLAYLKLTGKPIIDRSVLTEEDLSKEKDMSLLVALSPWLILVTILLILNFYSPLFTLLFQDLAMPISVIPGQVIKTRLLWNAYTWVLISTLLAALIIKPSGKALKETWHKWLKRAPRPTVAAAIFFAIAFVLNNSGMQQVGDTWQVTNPNSNMIAVLAQASAASFGSMYPFVSSFLGLFGGFVSGSEASTIAMFTKYHLLTSKLLNVDPLIVIAATAIGGGLASVISPAKLQNAAATIDALGIESEVIKTAFIISILLTTASAIMAMLFI
ncbi:L-lactate permease [Desulforamulus aeronauticus]|uniref:L-lactate permease n=1 Tax=Desulforamulus aeronauticus DSM 10349 TaxID=1121421 RepID=A0A1M6RJZ3_9FIRM|nr:L-lactate permease [Desulforamulus aeronauticus]SHK32805.1 lactate permease [Desulforamulus aeronauticus DSM 10349]